MFIAYSAAGQLVLMPEFRESALTVLDRISELSVGTASFRAEIARNMIRYNDPLGDPAELENRRADVRARQDAYWKRFEDTQAARDGK